MKKIKGKGYGLMDGSDQKYLANTRHLSRILLVLKDSKQKMCRYELFEITGMAPLVIHRFSIKTKNEMK